MMPASWIRNRVCSQAGHKNICLCVYFKQNVAVLFHVSHILCNLVFYSRNVNPGKVCYLLDAFSWKWVAWQRDTANGIQREQTKEHKIMVDQSTRHRHLAPLLICANLSRVFTIILVLKWFLGMSISVLMLLNVLLKSNLDYLFEYINEFCLLQKFTILKMWLPSLPFKWSPSQVYSK